VYFLLSLLAVLWGIQLLHHYWLSDLAQYGILPRVQQGLPHIFTAPFIHGSFAHLMSNTLPLMVFSWVCLLRGWAYYLCSSLFIIAVGGLGVWLFARMALHIGASGWIFGLWALIVSRALFEKDFKSILLSLLMLFFYGGMIYGVLPSESHISFEAHLSGLVAGIICAWLSSLLTKTVEYFQSDTAS